MSDERAKLYAAAASCTRYPVEAYEFLCHALAFTQTALDRIPEPNTPPEKALDKHVSGDELCDGIRKFALDQFGPMAPVVFRNWGIDKTQDFGDMVFHLIHEGVWYASPHDRREDFANRYDFDAAFVRDYKVEWEDGE
ncbi:MAG TPA: Minf_1886 family protein [Planctomycetia bacterium]|nr:Minf_1886 family protein [Planctomycetia bacterium]